MPKNTAPPVTGELVAREAEYTERTTLLVAQFGEGLHWDPDHYTAQIAAEMRRGCEAFLRAGRLLVVARGCASHGEWAGMMDRLGLESRQAQRMMEAARRVAALPNASTSTHLVQAAGTPSKLIELLSLPEDQFAQLAEEGETGELSLDGVAKMTVRDLREAVREARADLDAKDTRAQERERQIENLQKQLRKAKGDRAKATPEEATEQLRSRASTSALQVRADIGATGEDVDSLVERFTALRDHAAETGDASEHDGFLAGLVGELFGELRRLRDDMGLPIVNDFGAPDWQS
jgi:polyhydroxyalkanoate synthesis regulator phasin